ncbi:DUF5018 domain-containing protein [Galbibacter mesophilus]|uniref:DUF5018 domain-containing protein n=1 Tax=Galbibacter mesophilus TaxID=379069 RepID=UPI00191CE213|nr:DUF5018 domain-containing protein [Galbibacter mesophilus]MCM5662805.1 DUF5018 domain-containing protein [Galbibacter mesophilus]
MIKRIIFSFICIVLFSSCNKEEPEIITVYEPYESEPLSTENLITSFNLVINGEKITGAIDQTTRLITFETEGADIKALIPEIEYSNNATISPAPGLVQNFEDEVVYTVIAENGDPNVYRVVINNRPLSDSNEILSFKFNLNGESINARIDNELKEIKFETGSMDISNIMPTIEISKYATISPESGTVQDFNSLKTFIVTAENGDQVEYDIVINEPIITRCHAVAGIFSNSPMLLYAGTEMVVGGNFININRENTQIYLFDGQNSYPISITKEEQSENNFLINYLYYFTIPSTIPSGSNYKIVYEMNGQKMEYEVQMDILSENVPKLLSLNQTIYERGDRLELTGENLPDMMVIPSNGSLYLIQPSSSYDLFVNEEKTLLTLTLNNYYLFPSYYGREGHQRKITVLGPGRRVGPSITTIFD